MKAIISRSKKRGLSHRYHKKKIGKHVDNIGRPSRNKEKNVHINWQIHSFIYTKKERQKIKKKFFLSFILLREKEKNVYINRQIHSFIYQIFFKKRKNVHITR